MENGSLTNFLFLASRTGYPEEIDLNHELQMLNSNNAVTLFNLMAGQACCRVNHNKPFFTFVAPNFLISGVLT